MSEPSLEQMLEAELAGGSLVIGEVVLVRLADGRLQLTHRNTASVRRSTGLPPVRTAGLSPAVEFAPEQAREIAKFDDAGRYRPLSTAPTLRHGWKITVEDISLAVDVVEAIYPARLAAWRAWKLGRLTIVPLRETLNRQSGMYRVAARISDAQLDELVGNFCRSNGGCLRTILWQRDKAGQIASTKLPPEKFDPAHDQTGGGGKCIPLLCQEGCNLLVAACRDAVKDNAAPRALQSKA